MKYLTTGFFTFLSNSRTHRSIAVEQIDATLVKRFIKWLDARVNAKGVAYTLGTKRHMLGAVKAVLEQLKKAGADLDVADIVPYNPWPSDGPGEAKTSSLGEYDARMLGASLLTQVIKILGEAEALVDEFDLAERREVAHLEYVSSPADCASYLIRHYGGYIPERQTIAADINLPASVVMAVNKHGMASLTRFLGPSPADLIPLVNYLGFYTAFNEQPLLDLQLTEIQFDSAIGGRMTLGPNKNRAHHRVRRSFQDDGEPDSPVRLIKVLLKWTARIRQLASFDISNDLFVYIPKFRPIGNEVRSLSSNCPAGGADFRNHQSKLGAKLGIGYVGLRKIRATAAELILEASNGDVMATAAVLGQKNVATTSTHYRSALAKQTSELALAGAIAQRQRHIDSSGVVDARRFDEPNERSAATPGWICLDPLDSPIPGQKIGVLCSAYPFCPACPLAQPVSDRAIALARAKQLATKLQEAEQRLGPRPWRLRFGLVYAALVGKHIPFLDRADIREAAEAMRLSPLPDIE